MTAPLAIVGMACRYPGACTPAELWENVLAERRAFRRIPDERLRLADYGSADRRAADRTYVAEAAVIEGYEFDRVRFRVAGDAYRAADLAHWLALDVAADALGDAGFADGAGLPRETTGVLVGNSLTGEFSRAGQLRLRWPYVRRVMDASLAEAGWAPEERRRLLAAAEARYKAPFPAAGEETLAGGLSNTIAGRICNHFDLKGGGYTVDAACASSLLAVANACAALASGELDVALAGGVDLSLDPFELVGFARAGALAVGEMRVFDARSAGFLPGEGCGFVVLMRYADAVEQRRPVYAVVRGWGVSSDGSGGLTRPEVEGQLLALRRAYARAGFGPETVAYFEGHGTGTEVGDATELRVLSRARREAGADAPPAAVGSVKALIGHTKAAAGVAGLIKAALAVQAQVVPPAAGCEEPHPVLLAQPRALRAPRAAEPWPAGLPLRAAVSAMGFGGINTHVVLDGVAVERLEALSAPAEALRRSAQDAELVPLAAVDADGLRSEVDRLAALAAGLSRAEVADLAVHLQRAPGGGPARAAMAVATPAELARALATLRGWLDAGTVERLDLRAGIFLCTSPRLPRIGFLFPGQGSPSHVDGGILRRRFAAVDALYAPAPRVVGADAVATQVAQPAIAAASSAALAVLDALGIEGCLAVGHSLGELAALHWAGAMDRDALLRIAAARGATMAELGEPTGAMLGIAASHAEVAALLNGSAAVVAGVNAPRRVVVAGPAPAVAAVAERARERGWETRPLPVSHAFHSPLMAAAARPFAGCLARERFAPLRRRVSSTVTGAPLDRAAELPALLERQVTSPVLFHQAVEAVRGEVDLWLEAGPGHALTALASGFLDAPVLALDAGGPSLGGVLRAAGCAWTLGTPVRLGALYEGRFVRPFDPERRPHFFASPCELAPLDAGSDGNEAAPAPPPSAHGAAVAAGEGTGALEVVRRLVAERAELPPAAVHDEHRLLGDLHLNSITVGELVAQAARRLGQAPPAAPMEYADATVAGVARALEELAATAAPATEDGEVPAGVGSWVRAFVVERVERALPRGAAGAQGAQGGWRVLASPGHPLAEPLRAALAGARLGPGAAVCLPPDADERHVGLLLEGAREVLAAPGPARFLLLQHGGGGAAFARTLYLEASRATVCVVEVPAGRPEAVEWALAELRAAEGYTEAWYDAEGRRRVPLLRTAPPGEAAAPALGPGDVLLATGGGKGITAECALALARDCGARLALLGKSHPEEDAELAVNLERFAAAGVTARYRAADVADPAAAREAVHALAAELGPVTAVLHGAAVNTPRLIRSLDEEAVLRTLAPKVGGMRNVLAAVEPERLRLLLGFGSIIARMGMPGAADYALGNEWLARLVERFADEHPACRCLALEWSIWSGVGMGARLGSIDALVRAGISPVSPEDGVAALRALLARRPPAASLVVAGRFGDPPTLRLDRPDLPLFRFLEHPRVHYPGVELVADAELSVATDPYLDDHVIRGERLLPAVLGLEAMAQAAMALLGTAAVPAFEDVRFDRPVVVPAVGAARVRVAALAREDGSVEVVLRTEGTGFAADHFRALCRFGAGARPAVQPAEAEGDGGGTQPVGGGDLYGPLFFHRGRFRRVTGYRLLRARECEAGVAPDGGGAWFGGFLPQSLVLGDAGARDAAIHAIQACIPHTLVLPVGVRRLAAGVLSPAEPHTVRAREVADDGHELVYDVEVLAADGAPCERWEGLRLRRVGPLAPADGWAPALLAPYLERRVGELVPGAAVSVALEGGGGRRARSDRAMRRAAGVRVPVRRRPGGKPELVEVPVAVSAAHAGELTLGVAGPGVLGCDLERVARRAAAVWRDLLGIGGWALAEEVARETGEGLDAAATRVWAARECLQKAGIAWGAPLVVVGEAPGDGWVVLGSDRVAVPTCVLRLRGSGDELAAAMLVESAPGALRPVPAPALAGGAPA